MARKGRNFELEYEWLYKLDDKYKVTSPAYLYDKAADEKREVDVLVEYNDSMGYARKMAIECRDRAQNENVMWIEQLIQKREDLGLDFIVATTTKSFTEGALQKAKYHGVIVENAEMLDSKTIEDNASKFFLDVFFFKLELLELNFYVKFKGKKTFSEYFKQLNFAEQNQLLYEINNAFYFSIDPNTAVHECGFETKDFFSSEDNSMEINGNTMFTQLQIPPCMKDIAFLDWKIRVVPHKVTLPLSNSISVFDGNTHSNKNYRSIYGNSEEYFRIGYLDGKLFVEMNFKSRKYMRFAGMNLELNTIIPEGTDSSAMDQSEYIAKNFLGRFDLSKIQ